jgi:hypothetical protein
MNEQRSSALELVQSKVYVAGEASVVAAGDSDRNQSISSALSYWFWILNLF